MDSDLINKLKKDKYIIDIVKEPLINENLDTKDFIDRLNQIIIENYMSVLKSIKLIEKNYSTLYLEKVKFFESIKKAASYYDKLNRLWIDINDDNRILNSFSKLVALWLTPNLDPLKKASIYAEINEEIKNSDTKKVLISISILKKEYTPIYIFNKEYFLKIVKMISNPGEFTKLTAKEKEVSTKSNKKSFFGFIKN